MSLSESLCDITHMQIQEFNLTSNGEADKQALFAYTGEVFNKINPKSFSSEQISFCQSHIRILSGLYGVLKPLDLIQPYRLEMATKIITKDKKNLVEFWKNSITKILKIEKEIIINLASKEYIHSINLKDLNAKFLTIHFKEKKVNGFKVVGVYAKQARGMMIDFIVKNQIIAPQLLKKFTEERYRFNSNLSSECDWVFTRN